ncbi:hypothetical protein I656_00317 [Geobacillus sp. WSUCF1]|nr:hypothetical protein I656_00317 [Geobacillus sp. WSUCF1]
MEAAICLAVMKTLSKANRLHSPMRYENKSAATRLSWNKASNIALEKGNFFLRSNCLPSVSDLYIIIFCWRYLNSKQLYAA